jgi:hypothetical protein
MQADIENPELDADRVERLRRMPSHLVVFMYGHRPGYEAAVEDAVRRAPHIPGLNPLRRPKGAIRTRRER